MSAFQRYTENIRAVGTGEADLQRAGARRHRPFLHDEVRLGRYLLGRDRCAFMQDLDRERTPMPTQEEPTPVVCTCLAIRPWLRTKQQRRVVDDRVRTYAIGQDGGEAAERPQCTKTVVVKAAGLAAHHTVSLPIIRKDTLHTEERRDVRHRYQPRSLTTELRLQLVPDVRGDPVPFDLGITVVQHTYPGRAGTRVAQGIEQAVQDRAIPVGIVQCDAFLERGECTRIEYEGTSGRNGVQRYGCAVHTR